MRKPRAIKRLVDLIVRRSVETAVDRMQFEGIELGSVDGIALENPHTERTSTGMLKVFMVDVDKVDDPEAVVR